MSVTNMRFNEKIASYIIGDLDDILFHSFLFLDLVWSKNGSRTWWPAIIIVNPDQVSIVDIDQGWWICLFSFLEITPEVGW